MANPIKYNISSETRALNTGDFWIGTGDADKGPTSNTGYYVGPNVPSNGYVIYLYKDSQPGDLAYHKADNDSELISFTNKLADTSYTTVNECLNYFAGQDDKMVLNRDYEDIVTDGLVLNIDAGFIPSYPRNGTTTYDISENTNNGDIQNGVIFNSSPNSFVFDGTDDRVEILNNTTLQTTGEMSVNIWLKGNSTQGGGSFCGIFDKNAGSNFGDWACCGDSSNTYFRFGFNNTSNENKTYQVPSPYNDLKEASWVNYQCTYDFQHIRIYRNSVLVVEAAETSTPSTETFPVYLGYRGYGSYFTGEIAIAQLYNNKALSSEEVLQNYNAQKSRFGL